MKYPKNQKPLETGGFRIAWFIPIEMILSGLMLGLSPKIGLGWSIIVVGLPALIILVKVAKLEDKLSKPYYEKEFRQLQAEIARLGYVEYSRKHPFDYLYQPPYEEQVYEEMWATLNPLNHLPKLPKLSLILPKLHTKTVKFQRIV